VKKLVVFSASRSSESLPWSSRGGYWVASRVESSYHTSHSRPMTSPRTTSQLPISCTGPSSSFLFMLGRYPLAPLRRRFSSFPQKNFRVPFGAFPQLRTFYRSRITIYQPSIPQRVKSNCIPKPARYFATMRSSALDRDILPDNVKPVNYDISLFDLELGGGYSYQGTVAIQLKITKSSEEISLNSHQLKIHGAELSVDHTKTSQSFKATEISYDAPRQRATLTFPEELPVSENANLIIHFQGTVNNDMAGFYRSYV
jgi:hypothetical protein